jgi:hypothetical protein
MKMLLRALACTWLLQSLMLQSWPYPHHPALLFAAADTDVADTVIADNIMPEATNVDGEADVIQTAIAITFVSEVTNDTVSNEVVFVQGTDPGNVPPNSLLPPKSSPSTEDLACPGLCRASKPSKHCSQYLKLARAFMEKAMAAPSSSQANVQYESALKQVEIAIKKKNRQRSNQTAIAVDEDNICYGAYLLRAQLLMAPYVDVSSASRGTSFSEGLDMEGAVDSLIMAGAESLPSFYTSLTVALSDWEFVMTNTLAAYTSTDIEKQGCLQCRTGEPTTVYSFMLQALHSSLMYTLQLTQLFPDASLQSVLSAMDARLYKRLSVLARDAGNTNTTQQTTIVWPDFGDNTQRVLKDINSQLRTLINVLTAVASNQGMPGSPTPDGKTQWSTSLQGEFSPAQLTALRNCVSLWKILQIHSVTLTELSPQLRRSVYRTFVKQRNSFGAPGAAAHGDPEILDTGTQIPISYALTWQRLLSILGDQSVLLSCSLEPIQLDLCVTAASRQLERDRSFGGREIDEYLENSSIRR